MMTLKVMLVSMVALVIIMGWVVVIATDRYIDKQTQNKYDEPQSPHTEDIETYEDTPEVLAGSEMPKEMVDAMVDKPKRGRPKKNG
jgi:hypothetical protein